MTLHWNDNNPKCEGCSILKEQKPFHAFIDHEQSPGRCDVLFVSDSFKYENGQIVAFNSKEMQILNEGLAMMDPYEYGFTAAVKCPYIKENDISTTDRNICRQHIIDTITSRNPKIIYACGNLALRMITKKSGIRDKRGSVYRIDIEGKEYVVVPIYHPSYVFMEIEHKDQFIRDIKLSYLKYIKDIYQNLKLNYTLITSSQDLINFKKLITDPLTIAIDVETEGLNFLKDKVLSISYSWREGKDIKSLVIPVYHKDQGWSPEDLRRVKAFILLTLKNKKSRKIFHNASFDLRMLFALGATDIENVWDTKIMHHVLVSETDKKGLADLVKRYFPEYLEEF